MKIDKKLIKDLVDNLDEFNLTELEYQDGDKKVKVSKASKINYEQSKSSTVLSNNKSVLVSEDEEGVRVKSPIIGTAYLSPEPGAKKFIEIGDKITSKNITIKGPGGGILPKYYDIILDRQAKTKILKDFPIEWKNI